RGVPTTWGEPAGSTLERHPDMSRSRAGGRAWRERGMEEGRPDDMGRTGWFYPLTTPRHVAITRRRPGVAGEGNGGGASRRHGENRLVLPVNVPSSRRSGCGRT